MLNTHKKLYGLVVDDEGTIRQMLAESVAEIDQVHFVVQAENGNAALIKLGNQSFDFALIDLSMPRLGGLELIEKIRENEKKERKKAMPIIIVSGNVESEAVKKALSLGIKDIIVKPFKADEITGKVKQILKLK